MRVVFIITAVFFLFCLPYAAVQAGPLLRFQINQPLNSYHIDFGHNVCYRDDTRAPCTACEAGVGVPSLTVQHWRDAKQFQWCAAGGYASGIIASKNGRQLRAEGCNPVADSWPTQGQYSVIIDYIPSENLLRCKLLR